MNVKNIFINHIVLCTWEYFKSLSVAFLETLLCFSMSSVRTLLCCPIGFCRGVGVPSALLSEWAWPHSGSPASFPRALLSQNVQPCGVLARLACGVQSLKVSVTPGSCHGSAVGTVPPLPVFALRLCGGPVPCGTLGQGLSHGDCPSCVYICSPVARLIGSSQLRLQNPLCVF